MTQLLHKCACEEREYTVTSEKAEILLNRNVNSEYMHIAVRCSDVAAKALPGQFFQLRCPQIGENKPFFRRPMSLYGVDPTNNIVEFLYKIAGTGTKTLALLKAGDYLDIMGPLGKGFEFDGNMKNIVAVGRGAGLATLAPLAEAARKQRIHVTAILSARSPEYLVSVELFKMQGADVITVLDSDGSSTPDNMEKILRKLISDNKCDAFFTCGSSRLLKLQQKLANEFNLNGQVALEEHMACGIGLCHCCIRKFNINGKIVTKRVCTDGPVFNMREVL